MYKKLFCIDCVVFQTPEHKISVQGAFGPLAPVSYMVLWSSEGTGQDLHSGKGDLNFPMSFIEIT